MKIADVVVGEHYASSTEGWKLDARTRHRLRVDAMEARDVKRYSSWRDHHDVQNRRGVVVTEVDPVTGEPITGYVSRWYEGARILEMPWADYEAQQAALQPLEDKRREITGRLLAELDHLLGKETYHLRARARHDSGIVAFDLRFEDGAAEKLIAALEADR